ncbi:class I SAM-dependent methyltransferase [Amycolatopsis acidiphila]|uniref:Class I SAM-dependent methyltransferase n=1 Tax=Amycolatopsis acidiphila TaxID=715473 RepID=A0A558AD47_9PSEU|nr:class I SAM-dependent methyltransferase [Amycolatopsis acidiphila]TVT22190.1 class I SAM-dependent methyltransferase [Amycolatopsis acidiphila]UIJ61611.1 class I SAM-dependent methyltransferase [Amycolatopsis acidiphila]GHG58905.1 methyltransferase type 11 [Amycolatopsis acidiphila]
MWNAVRRGLKALSRDGGVVPSPNIWYYPEVYEVENRAQDVDGEIWRVLGEETPWSGRDVLDLGCGDGFHLPKFAESAKTVLGVEPHEPLVHKARRRVSGFGNVNVLAGSAQRVPVPDSSVDVVHARTAYFFGPGCEPGLREVDRILRPGGVLAIVDLDVTAEPYGRWMRADLPHYDPVAVETFFARSGFRYRRVATRWHFAGRAELESVLKIEFSPEVAARAIEDVLRANAGGEGGYTVPVGYRVHVREKPTGLVLPGHSSSSSASISPRIP